MKNGATRWRLHGSHKSTTCDVLDFYMWYSNWVHVIDCALIKLYVIWIDWRHMYWNLRNDLYGSLLLIRIFIRIFRFDLRIDSLTKNDKLWCLPLTIQFSSELTRLLCATKWGCLAKTDILGHIGYVESNSQGFLFKVGHTMALWDTVLSRFN